MTILLSRLFKKFVQDPASRNFDNASLLMMIPPRLDSDEEGEAASSGTDTFADEAAVEKEYLKSFENGLNMIDEEYSQAMRFLTTSLEVMAKSSGVSWCKYMGQVLIFKGMKKLQKISNRNFFKTHKYYIVEVLAQSLNV